MLYFLPGFKLVLSYQKSLQFVIAVSNRTTKKCPCRCHFCSAPALAQRRGIMSELLVNVDSRPSTTSRTRFQDWRASSVAAGSMAVGILSCILCWLVLIDALTLARYLQSFMSHCPTKRGKLYTN